MADWWSGSKLKLYIDKDDFKKYYGKEHGYCVMNHTYEIDWLIGWMLADRVRLLGVSMPINFNCGDNSKLDLDLLFVRLKSSIV